MNKKQRNRKLVTQNKRNRMINRRYTSNIKSLSKLFLLKINNLTKEILIDKITDGKKESFLILNSLYSIIDKAVKKKVIHQNTAARKKSKITKLYSKIS
jgi:small subunit ribosomal protein S20